MKRNHVRAAIEDLIGVPIRGMWRCYRERPTRHKVWRVELRRGKEIGVDLELREIHAERWGLGWTPIAYPGAAKTVRDIYESGDEPGPENAEGKRRVTMDDYLAWRLRAVPWTDLGHVSREAAQKRWGER